MKFLHVMLRTVNAEKALKFYKELFEMNLVRTMKLSDSELFFLADEDGQTQIELTYNFETPAEGYKHGNAFGHLAFEVDSIDEFSAKMNNLGYGSVAETYDMPEYEIKIAFINDPDGNTIELVEPVYN